MHNAELFGKVIRCNYAQPRAIKGGQQGWSAQPVWADADKYKEDVEEAKRSQEEARRKPGVGQEEAKRRQEEARRGQEEVRRRPRGGRRQGGSQEEARRRPRGGRRRHGGRFVSAELVLPSVSRLLSSWFLDFCGVPIIHVHVL